MNFTTVRLKNGAEAPSIAVTTTMSSLRLALEQQPDAFLDLVLLCRDPKHEVKPESIETLTKMALMREGCVIHDHVMDIVLSAVGRVPGLGLFHIESPIEGE